MGDQGHARKEERSLHEEREVASFPLVVDGVASGRRIIEYGFL